MKKFKISAKKEVVADGELKKIKLQVIKTKANSALQAILKVESKGYQVLRIEEI